MAQNNRIDFQLNFKKGDTAVLQSLKRDIAEIQRMAGDVDFTAGMSISEVNKMVTAARSLETALDQAFDVDLNTINIQKFNQILKQSGYDAKTLQSDLSMAGATGQQAFLKMTSQLMQFNTVTKQTNQFLDNIATTLFNTIKWTVMSSIVNSIASTVQKSYGYVKSLDSALNDIRIVTGKSAEDMERFAESANNAAKALAVTTSDYTEGSLIYYQQGLDDETVKTLTDITAKTSNVTGQAMSTVSEELTAVQNGYKVANQAAEEGMQVYEEYVDKMAAVGASTASNLEELSTAMSKVASAASNMGVGFDDLNAQIATIVSVTRQAPESVGTALKTIYARLGDLKVDGVDEFGTKLGEVSSQLQTMGINILDSNGDMRQMSEVITEVAQKQSTQTSAQKEAAAVAMAGKRQYNNLVALFENQDMYGEALETSMNAAGTLEKQQETALESLANKMDVLKATAEDLYDSLFDTDTIIGFVEAGTGVLQFFADFSDAIGGLNNLLPMLGSIGLQVFSEQIGRGLATIVINARNAVDATKMMIDNQNQLRAMFQDSSILNTNLGDNEALKSYLNELLSYYQEMSQYQGIMSQEQKEQYNNILKMKEAAGSLAVEVEEQKNSQLSVNQISKTLQVDINKFKISTKEVNNIINETSSIMSAINTAQIDGAIEEGNFGKIFQNLNLEAGKTENLIKLIENEVKAANGNIDKGIENTIQKLQQSNNTLTEILNKEGKIKSFADSSKILGDSLASGLNTQAVITNVMNVVGALGQLASAINMIHNLGSIQNNEDISTGEKILQIIMNIGFALPMLATSLGKIGEAFNFTSLFNAIAVGYKSITTAQTAQTAAQVAQNTVSGITDVQQKTKLANLLALIPKEELDAAITGEKTAADVASIAVNKAKNRVTEEELIALKAHITYLAADKKATDAANASKAAFNATLLASPVLQFAVAIGGIIAALTAYSNSLKKAREEQIKYNEEEIEFIKNKQEEVETNNKLVDSYMNLYKTYKETGNNKEELYQKSVELVDVYNIENGRILALNESYDILAKKIREASKAKLDSEIGNAKIAAGDLSENIINADVNNKKTPTHLIDNELVAGYTGDFDEVYQAAAEKIFKGNTHALFDDGGASLQLAYNKDDYKDVLAYTQDITKALEYLENSFTKEQLQSSSFYLDLKEQYKGFIDNAKELENQIDIISSKTVDLKFSEVDFDDLKNNPKDVFVNFEKLYSKVKEIKEELKDEIPEDSIDKYVNNILDSFESIPKEYISKIETINEYISKYKAVRIDTDIDEKQLEEEAFKIINDLNKKQLLQLEANLDSAVLDEELTDQVEKNKTYLTFIEQSQLGTDSKNLLEGYDSKKGFDKDKVNSFFANEENSKNLGVTQEQFDILDEGQKLQLVTEKQIENTKATEKAREETIKTQEELIEQLKAEDGAYAQAAVAIHNYEEKSHISKTIDEQVESSEKLKDKTEELKQALMDSVTPGKILTEIQEELINTYKEEANVSDLVVEGYGKNLVAGKQLQQELDNQEKKLRDAQSILEATKDSAISFEDAIKNLSKTTELHNAVLDDLQSKYKTLINIVDNYNETGKQTIDNVQTLMSMSDQYVAQLEFEGNQLSLNEEGFKAVTLAKLDDLQATEELAYQEKINELALIAVSNANDIAAQKEALHANQLEILGEVAEGTTAKMYDLAEAMAQIDEFGSDELKNARDQAEKAHENRKKAIEDLKNQVRSSSGSGGLRTIMGAEKKDKSSSSKDKKQDKKEYEDEFDRYWEIKKAIDAVDKAISRLDKDQQNLHGEELIASLKQENELIKQQTENYEKLYEMQKQEAEELRAQLSTMGLIFDANGAITNYAAATSAALAQYTAAIEQYNAGLIDETTLKVFEKSYENFKKLLERYDALYYTEMQDTQDKIDDMRRKMLANNLKAWEVKIELKLEKTKIKRDQNDFLKDIKQDFTKVQSDLTIDSSFDRDNFKEYMKDVGTTLKAIEDVEKEIDKMKNGEASSMFESISQAQEKLKELQEQLLEQGKSLYELYKALQQNYLDGMDQVKDKYDELISRYKHLDNELKFQKELIELIYGDKAYDLMNKYYDTQEHNIEAQISSLKTQMESQDNEFNKSYQEALKRGVKVDLDNFTTQTEDMKKAYDYMIEAQEDLNDLVLEGVKVLQDKQTNSINQIIDDMNKKMYGMSFDDMKKEQEWAKNLSDLFLDDTQKAYKIQGLANKMAKDISKMSNIKNQQKLQALKEQEIEQLREQKDLTQEDVELAEMRYQIALKEIALEDAQNNKTSMKLTRNEQGNQSYQYVADEDDVTDKQEDYMNSMGDYYEKALSYRDRMTEAHQDAIQQRNEELASVEALFQNGKIDYEEYQKELMAIEEKYGDTLTSLAERAEVAKREAISVTSQIFGVACEQDATLYETLTEDQKRMVDGQKDTALKDFREVREYLIGEGDESLFPNLYKVAKQVFEDTDEASKTTASKMIEQQATNPDSFKKIVLEAINKMVEATKDYGKKLDDLQKVADKDFSKIGEDIDKVDKKINDMNGDTEKLASDSEKYLDELRKLLEEVAEAWKEVSEKILDAKEKMDDYAQAVRDAKAAENSGSPSSGGPSKPDSPIGGPGDGDKDSPDANGSKGRYGIIAQDGHHNNVTTRVDSAGEKGLSFDQARTLYANKSREQSEAGLFNFQFKNLDNGQILKAYRTGGYTGEQADNNGRLAVLHQKELVLNADDTKNFLAGINTIRDLTALNGSISNAIISSIAGMAMNLAGISPSSVQGQAAASTANNTYNITAEFPNAYSAEEIKQAILTLPNYASQYANRNVM